MDNDNTTEQQNVQSSVTPLQEPVLSSNEQASVRARNSSKRKVTFAAAAFLAIGLMAFGIVYALNQDSSTNNTVANDMQEASEFTRLASSIAVVEGQVEYSTGGITWAAVEPGQTLNENEHVRTLNDSRAVVLLDDGSAVRLNENSHIQLTVTETMMYEVLLIEGDVYSRVVESDDRTFAVVTERERFEALGTAFRTSTKDEVDSLEVYQSKVFVDSADVEVEEGNSYDTEKRKASSLDLEALKDDEFIQWNTDNDQKDDKFKDKLGVLNFVDEKPEEKPTQEPAPTTQPGTAPALSASAEKVDKGVKVSWTLSDVTAPDGFKIVYDTKDSTPSYKENAAQYAGPDSRSQTVWLDDGMTYYVRVCIYRAKEGGCDTYSNMVKVTAPLIEKEAVKSGAVSLNLDGTQLSWTFEGTAPHGFKVVLNDKENPTYPANSIQYIGSGKTTAELPEKPPGTYYVRVCKYTADAKIENGCMNYSNQLSFTVEEL